MSYLGLLPETCSVYRRTVDTSGKRDIETWFALETVKCRVLKQSITRANAEKTQYSTIVRTRFAVPKFCQVAIRDRISHGDRTYDVIEVVAAFERTKSHHKIAVCEVFAGGA